MNVHPELVKKLNHLCQIFHRYHQLIPLYQEGGAVARPAMPTTPPPTQAQLKQMLGDLGLDFPDEEAWGDEGEGGGGTIKGLRANTVDRSPKQSRPGRR